MNMQIFKPSTRQTSLAAVFGTLCLSLGASSASRALDLDASAAPMVVELYTSQGCSSCPPADKILGELAKRPEILALSFHVDYWDYIGWKDPLAIPLSANRQRKYAEQLKLRYVYTPQIIVDGETEAVGSRRKDIAKCLYKANESKKIALKQVGDLSIALPTTKLFGQLDIWQVAYKSATTTDVERGENHGKRLHHVNSVRAFHHIGKWDGSAKTLTVSNIQTKPPHHDTMAILIQEPKNGPIRAALVLK